MIKITLEQLINSSDALRNLSQKQLKARSAYTVAKLIKAADTEMTNFNDVRVDLVKKYAEKDENGELILDENQNIKVPPENIEKFNIELQELLKTTIEINANKISIDDLEDIQFTPTEMAQLDEFIEFE